MSSTEREKCDCSGQCWRPSGLPRQMWFGVKFSNVPGGVLEIVHLGIVGGGPVGPN